MSRREYDNEQINILELTFRAHERFFSLMRRDGSPPF
jgi:hypothetical protein